MLKFRLNRDYCVEGYHIYIPADPVCRVLGQPYLYSGKPVHHLRQLYYSPLKCRALSSPFNCLLTLPLSPSHPPQCHRTRRRIHRRGGKRVDDASSRAQHFNPALEIRGVHRGHHLTAAARTATFRVHSLGFRVWGSGFRV